MTRQTRRRGANSDRGAAAVEFALLLPLLLLLVFGIIDFGRAINAQITINQAAREGARVLALPGGTAQAAAPAPSGELAYQARALAAATGLSGVTITDLPDTDSPAETGCPAGAGATGDDAVVQVTYKFKFVTPIGAIASIFGKSGSGSSGLTLNAKGVMPCET
jgi:Flp pilus assembly protein TadG